MTTSNVPAPTGRIMLNDVRLSFAQGLVQPSTIPGAGADAKPKWNCGLLLEPTHAQLEDIRAKMRAVAKEKWEKEGVNKATKKPVWEEIYAALEKQDRLALHDGDLKPNYDGYPGNFFLSPNADENKRPTLIDGQKNHLDEKSVARVLFSGCRVNASIEIWAQDNKFGKRINATLRGVQYYKEGDAFGAGRPADSDEFEAVTEGAEAEDFA